jgi:Meckel syndrome type 1 protein
MRIRVIPDALGTIDVALRRDGDSVQVQLTAEQPQTRALLADAQPRLTEMAEARGLKLQHAPAGTGTGGGSATAQGDRQQQQQPQRGAPLPAAPVSARRAGPAEADDTDQRIA